jgi:hypothetical protein
MKALFISLAIVCVILIGCLVRKNGGTNTTAQYTPASSMKKNWTATELAELITSLSPWSSERTYNRKDWNKMIEVAAVFQASESNLVVQAFDQFSNQNTNNFHIDYLEDSKAYLLLQVIFDLPEHAKGYPSRGGGWLSQRRDVNPDGTINLDWPLSWNGEKPSLISEYLGYEGFNYSPSKDYCFLVAQFKMRRLPPLNSN